MRAAFLFCLFTASCWAADLTGPWIAERTLPSGAKRETILRLRQEGATLTGTITVQNREMPIRNGKVEGNSFSFEQVLSFGGEERVITYKGTIKGDDLEIRTEGGMPRPGGPGARPMRMAPMIARRLTPEMEKARAEARAKLRGTLPALKELPDNGLARTPPMGWNSWNHFRTKIDDKTIREIADATVSSGMKAAGYLFVNIDDGWQGKRDEQGNILGNAQFPDMKALADYVHSRGLKLGIYSSPGPRTCAGFEGSLGHEEQDARRYAAWGIDYLKHDWCSAAELFEDREMRAVYQRMGEALRAAGRPIVFSLCQYGREKVWEWGPLVGGNLWRTTGDIRDQWRSMANIGFQQQTGLEKRARPGHWNDPDMLEVGNGGMNNEEYKTHFSLWSILAAPLLAGNDLRNMTEETTEILTNREVIAVDQDSLGKQGHRVAKGGDQEVWMRPLAGGATAVGLFNLGDAAARVEVKWPDIGAKGTLKVRDLWERKDLGRFAESFSAAVAPHGVVLIRLSR